MKTTEDNIYPANSEAHWDTLIKVYADVKAKRIIAEKEHHILKQKEKEIEEQIIAFDLEAIQ